MKIFYAYFHDKDGVIVREISVKETAKAYIVASDDSFPFKTIRKNEIGRVSTNCLQGGFGLTAEQSVDTLKKSALATVDDLQLRLAYYQRIVTKAEEYVVGKYRKIAAAAEEYGS